MKIIREGKEIELTSEELASAHAEFVTNFMRKTLEEDFDVAPEDSQQLAEQAYDRYCEGNGETEYECIEAVYFESGEDSYYYCFEDEGCHIIYHRFMPEDYRDLFSDNIE